MSSKKRKKKTAENLLRKKKQEELLNEKQSKPDLVLKRSQVDIAMKTITLALGKMVTFILKKTLETREFKRRIMIPFRKVVGFISPAELKTIVGAEKDAVKYETDYLKELGVALNGVTKELDKKIQKIGRLNHKIQLQRKTKPNPHAVKAARKKLEQYEAKKQTAGKFLDSLSKALTIEEDIYKDGYTIWRKATEEILPPLLRKRDELRDKFESFLENEYEIIVKPTQRQKTGKGHGRRRQISTKGGTRTDLHTKNTSCGK